MKTCWNFFFLAVLRQEVLITFCSCCRLVYNKCVYVEYSQPFIVYISSTEFNIGFLPPVPITMPIQKNWKGNSVKNSLISLLYKALCSVHLYIHKYIYSWLYYLSSVIAHRLHLLFKRIRMKRMQKSSNQVMKFQQLLVGCSSTQFQK